jgi:hypothetical protein
MFMHRLEACAVTNDPSTTVGGIGSIADGAKVSEARSGPLTESKPRKTARSGEVNDRLFMARLL